MRKIIAIGKCGLDILMDGSQPSASCPGGRILNAAARLGQCGYEVAMVGECGADNVGDIVVSYLEDNGVNTRSIDRYTDGVTPTTLIFHQKDRENRAVSYERYPEESFDVVWPRIDADDIIIFGAYFSIDPRVRTRLLEIINYASERKAIIVYAPGFWPSQVPRITKVMPAILENLELADIVITRTQDLQAIYSTADPTTAYRDHVSFYCRTMLNADISTGRIELFNGSETASGEGLSDGDRLAWDTGIISGVAAALVEQHLLRNSLDNLTDSERKAIVDNAIAHSSERIKNKKTNTQ